METPMTVETLARYISAPDGFHGFLGMQLLEADAEKRTLSLKLPFSPSFARIPAVGDYHGGIIASVLDVAGTFACMLAAARPTPTSNMRIDYLKPAIRCDLIVKARVLRVGGSLLTADAEAGDGAGAVFAVARGVWVNAPPRG